VILYGIGGLSDVGRHSILAALEKPTIDKVTIITEYPEKLDETNWECNCPGGHTNPMKDDKYASKINMVPIDTWDNDHVAEIAEHFRGASAVISCLGHRQPGRKYPELIEKGLIAYKGNKQVIQAMKKAGVERVVAMSSIAINGNNDWPHWAAGIMKLLFKTGCRKAKKDLEAMERMYLAESKVSTSKLDYLLVRPVGIGEEAVPVGKYFLQEAGNKKEVVGGNMAKMDCARFMVDEAVHPTLHRTSQVVGAEPGTPM